MREKAYFKISFDKKGRVVGAELTDMGRQKECMLTQGREVTPGFLAEKFEEHPNIEVIGSIIRLSGSPDCIIYLDGYKICVCNCG